MTESNVCASNVCVVTEQKIPNRIVLVTGGNKGIGLEIVNGLSKIESNTVILTCRKEEDGLKTVEHFKKLGRNNVEFRRLDLTEEKSIEALIKNILSDFKHVDILVNNAGIYLDGKIGNRVLASATSIPELELQMKVNTIGPLRLMSAFIHKMKERNFGRIVNMSSMLGSLSANYSHSLGYRISKTALNMITRTFASEVEDKNILINSVSPGYVRTDMTGGENSKAPRSAEEGADTAIWLAMLDDKGPRGGFFQDRKPLDW